MNDNQTTRPRAKAFTLIELLVVIAIICLLLSILVPALGRIRILSQRAYCKANIRQLAHGDCLYSIDYQTHFSGAWNWVSNQPWDPTDDAHIKKGLLWPYMGGALKAYVCPRGVGLLTPPPGSSGDTMARTYCKNWNSGESGSQTQNKTSTNLIDPAGFVLFAEENSFKIPGLSHYTINDGALYAPPRNWQVDCFATYHETVTKGDDLTQGVSYASFADGHAGTVSPYGQSFQADYHHSKGILPNAFFSATTRWMTDGIRNPDMD